MHTLATICLKGEHGQDKECLKNCLNHNMQCVLYAILSVLKRNRTKRDQHKTNVPFPPTRATARPDAATLQHGGMDCMQNDDLMLDLSSGVNLVL